MVFALILKMAAQRRTVNVKRGPVGPWAVAVVLVFRPHGGTRPRMDGQASIRHDKSGHRPRAWEKTSPIEIIEEKSKQTRKQRDNLSPPTVKTVWLLLALENCKNGTTKMDKHKLAPKL